jgi:hypothetical protein
VALTNVSANIAVAIFKVATAVFAETMINTKHSTRLSPESRRKQFMELLIAYTL